MASTKKAGWLLASVAAGGLLISPVLAQVAPGGGVLYLDSNTPFTPNTYTQYSTTVTATTTGPSYALFAFREQPAFFYFDDASITAAGSSVNLLTNPGFEGGSLPSTQSSYVQVPVGWGTIYQTGTVPGAAGTVSDQYGAHGGSYVWYDGSVESFDGIYQTINTVAGQQYLISFYLKGDEPFSTPTIEMATYFGACGASNGSCATSFGNGFTISQPAAPTINTTDGDLAADRFSLASPAVTGSTVQFQGGTLVTQGGSFADNIVSAPVTLTARNGTVDTTPGSGGFSGVVSGPGSLTVTGGNTFSLTGANTYTGGTQLQSGTLLVGNDSALGTGTLTMANGSTLKETSGVTLGNTAILSGTAGFETSDALVQGEGLVYNGVISGTGTLLKTGSSGLRLTAANTYAGGTIIADGHIGITDGNALGTGTVTFAGGSLNPLVDGLTVGNAAVLSSNGTIGTSGHDLTYAGTISGAGQLVKTDAGTLALTSPNAYTGGTVLNGGTLRAGDGAALGTGTLTVNAGTLQAGAPDLTIGNAVTLAAAGTIDTQALNLTMSGVIAGPGQLTKTGSGTLALAGQNTFSGGAVLTAGTVVLSNSSVDGGMLSSSIGTGTLTFNGGTLLNGASTTAGLTVANPVAINGSGGVIDANSANLNFTAPLGNGQGLGTLTFANTGGGDHGVVLLGATASFSGQATIANGAFVILGADDAIGTGNVKVDGVLNLGTSNQSIARLTGQGTIIDNAGFGPGTSTSNSLVIQSGAFGGSIQENDGRQIALTKTSNGTTTGGTLVLSGTNAYAGPTTVAAGTLLAGSRAAFSPDSAFTVAGRATLDVGGYASKVASLAGAGTVTNNGTGAATLTTGRSGASSSFAGVLADGTAALGLVKAGTGTLTLTGPSTFTGGTDIRAGTVELGNSTALGSGPVVLDEGTELRFVADGLTLANAVDLRDTDPTIDTGGGFETISGPISGPGQLTKIGSGTLDLTGTSSYTGATAVAGGTLLVDGALLASTVTVGDGATLGGRGSVAGVVVGSSGRLAPSGSQALTIAGNLQFLTGSSYQVTVNADGTNSKLAVAGSVDLSGAALSVLAGSGTFRAGSYTLLTAGTLRPGTTFATVTTADSLALLRPQVNYDYAGNDVSLTLNPVAFRTIAATSNQAGVAGAIQNLGAGNGLYDAVVGLDATQARQAFNATSGVTHANTQAAITSFARTGTTLLLDRLWDVSGSGLSAQQVLDQFATDRLPALVRCYGPAPDALAAPAPPTYTAWGEAFGTFGHTDARPNAGPLDRSLGGFILGIDTPLDRIGGDKWRAGLAGGYSNTSFRSPLDGGSGTVQNVFGSLYGGARYGAVDLRVGTVAGGTFVDARRDVAFGGAPLFNEVERSSNTGYTVQTFGEVGYRVPAGTVVVEPIAGAAYLHSHQDGFSEKGGVAALTVAAQDTDLGTTTLGIRAEAQPFKDLPIVVHTLLGWQHVIGDVSPATTLAFASAPLDTFSVIGAPIDRDALAAEAALDYRVSARLDVGLTYVGQIGATAADHSVKGRLEYRF